MPKPEWAIGLTHEEYDFIIRSMLMWHNLDGNFGLTEWGNLLSRFESCRDSAIKHGVFDPTDKKLED